MQPAATDYSTGVILLLIGTGVPFILGCLLGWRVTFVVLRLGWAALIPGPIRAVFSRIMEMFDDE